MNDLSALLCTEQLDTATKQQAAREADQKQNIFVKLLEQSKFSEL